ncbi:MAG TPA: Maf family protein [Paenalcaligenes sp.]|nr:Maf family protein [Paenalcaligenes sp.]
MVSLYLASASPRRHDILNQLNIPHDVLQVPSPAGEDEPILPGESPKDYAQRTTQDKLRHALNWISTQALDADRPVLCADTCVALDNEVLGKPQDTQQAEYFLGRMSGRTHQVYTAQALGYRGRIYSSLSINHVVFRPLNAAEIRAYCATGEPFGKAGGYGIQGHASYFIDRLEGRYSAVMGLDIYDLYQLLEQAQLQHLCFLTT